ncbi:transcriptional regulator SdrP [Microbulbifer sp. NBRC 101763]|uniref:Crp/Fnr family transcriptional regulator n=1 Tax=Microbulbifer TaxID=48073 RepID=UPI00036B602F|nr:MULTISPECIES: Crp/Fnr family transcriptional regulator [Microbulbifer]WHI53198.1 Crp/Fnr family transcriptional regulator [Microbulbifer sp. MLAF003]
MQEIAAKTKRIYCAKETVLFRQGQESRKIYFIHTGYVLIHKVDFQGNSGLVDLYGPGSWFGPGLGGNSQDIEAIAKIGCELEVTFPENLNTLMLSLSQTPEDLIEHLANRESLLQQRIFQHITAPLPVRLASLLSQLFYFRGQPCAHGHELDVRLSQSELAAMAGGSRQTVSQLLNRWKQEGVIDYTRQHICLLNKNALKDLAQG